MYLLIMDCRGERTFRFVFLFNVNIYHKSMSDKTIIYTTFYVKNPSYESLIWEWLISLRTLGNYKGKVIIFDYGMPKKLVDKLNKFSLGAPTIIPISDPADSGTISNWRNIDVIPYLEEYEGYKFAHFDADIWFQNDVNKLWDELEEIEGCYVGVETGRSCRYRGPEEEDVENEYMKVQQKLGGFVFGGWIGGKYEPFLNKLKKMDELWSNNWGIKEWGTDQCMITYLADFENDNFNGIKYGCSWYFCDVKENKIYINTKNKIYPFENKEAIGVHIIAFNSVGNENEDKYLQYRFKTRYPELWQKHQ